MGSGIKNTNGGRRVWIVTVLTTLAVFVALSSSELRGQNAYVDAVAGSDSADGRSIATAWRTIERVNAATFQPGDTIRLKRGSVWNSTSFHPAGSGAAGRPIVVAAYGSGNAPAIHAGGAFSAAVLLQNQAYWQITDLEVSNRHPSNPLATRYGVYVLASNIGAVRHIVLRNLSVHDVNGDPGVKTCGGIFAEIIGGTTPTWFDSLVIEGCTIADVSPVGIANTSTWATRTLTGNTNWTPSLNVLVRNNTVARTVRNGIIIRVSHRPVIERNVLQECAKDSSGNALFVFNCDSAMIQYNEAFLTRFNPGDEDAGGIDADYRCKNTIIQYNYCHDNEYGGIVVVSDGSGATTFNDGTVVRYNVLKNNRNHVIRTSGNVTNTTFHNNTILSDPGAGSVIVVWHKSWGGYASGTKYLNNIFEIQRSGSSFQLGSSTNNLFDYNLFHGIRAAGEPADAHKLTGDPLFADTSSVGTGWASAAGLALTASSPAINAGTSVAGHPQRDFLGQQVPYGGLIDRGAFEFQGAPTGVRDRGDDPQKPSLGQAYPNPSNPLATIRFHVARTESVSLTVHDLLGARVATIADGNLAEGTYAVTFDGSRLPSGVYFYTLRAGPFVETRRLVLLK